MKNEQVKQEKNSSIPRAETETNPTLSAAPAWEPRFSPWRHGGWYVDNLSILPAR